MKDPIIDEINTRIEIAQRVATGEMKLKIINEIEKYKVEKKPLCEQNVLLKVIIEKIKNLTN